MSIKQQKNVVYILCYETFRVLIPSRSKTRTKIYIHGLDGKWLLFSAAENFLPGPVRTSSVFFGSGWIRLSLVRCLQLVGMFCHSPSPSHSLIAPLSFDIQHNVYRACSSMFCIQFERKLKLEFDQPASNSHPGSALSGIFSFPRISQSVLVAKIGERPGKNQTRKRVIWVKRVK